MSRESGRAHYVRHNAITRVPRSFVYLDTEAHRVSTGRREVQTFRCAVAAFDTINRHNGKPTTRQWCEAEDTSTLWDWITDRCRAKARTVLVAHNLAYDLRIANAFVELPARGWEFVNGRIDDRQAWVLWRKDERTLACVDSTSWVPVALDRLGELVGVEKLPLPEEGDSAEVWFERCRRDVEILAEVWTRLVGWVEAEDLGNWKFSGAGQSWSAFRHRFYTHRLLVHANDDARTAERAAAMTGRCEAWQHGKLNRGPYVEWDYTTAYASIGVECDLPVSLVGEVRAPTAAKVALWSAKRAVLCEVEVSCDVPVLATRTESGILWPVGTFTTTCWDHELALAVEQGACVDVHRAWLYRRAPALRDFCAWVLAGVDGSRSGVDPVVRVALKHWSRAIVGRMAAQWTRWDVVGSSPLVDVSVYRCLQKESAEWSTMMQLGHQLMLERARPENPDAMVAVMSWIMAESRVRLWRAMEVAGFENVVYVDTDSLIVTPSGDERLSKATPAGLRVKGRWSSIEVLGPRQIVPGGVLRAAGVPRGAERVSSDTWTAEVWRGLSRSLRVGEPDSVEVARRVFRLRGVDKRRTHLPLGATSPKTVSAGAVTARVGA